MAILKFMSAWLYQLNSKDWSPETFRFEIWEGQRWHWGYGTKRGGAGDPKPGDTVVFFYAKTGGDDPGIHGWAVLDRCEPDDHRLYFVPAAPTNYLKMTPWWDKEAAWLPHDLRGVFRQALGHRKNIEQELPSSWTRNGEDIASFFALLERALDDETPFDWRTHD